MLITYKTVDLKEETVDLTNAIDVQINGINITETEEGIRVAVEREIVIKGQASNAVEILKPKS